MLRLTVLGAGYLGTTHAACMASVGFDVLGVDANAEKVARLSAGELPIFEPGLEEMLNNGLAAGRLRFTTSYAEAAAFGDVHFVCVSTPQRSGSCHADLSHVQRCIEALAPLLARPCLVVGRSTVPVGTAASCAVQLARLSPAGQDVELAWNPEFLREGMAIADTLQPDRIIAGVGSERAAAILREVYAAPLAAGAPLLLTDLATAELAKVAANAFLATKISFINAMAQVCEATGADVVKLSEMLGHDARIGHLGLRPGLGFGGGCLPKDLRAFTAQANDLGLVETSCLLQQVDSINTQCRAGMVDLARKMMGGSFADRAVCVLGAAFKPDSDDIRDSPALEVAKSIHDLGALVTVCDPAALGSARRAYPDLGYAQHLLEAARGAHLVLLLTEWQEFRDADPEIVGGLVAQRNIIDGRNALNRARWQAAGWHYRAVGRP